MPTSWLEFSVRTWSLLAQASPAAPPSNTSPGAPAAPAVPTVPSTAGMNAAVKTVGAAVPEAHSMAYTIAQNLGLTLYMLVCIGLIACVTLKTSKNDGLGAVFSGGGAGSTFRGKQSSDEMLSVWTSRLAVGFLVSSFLLWFVFYRG